MDISKLGEFGLIDRLASGIATNNSSTVTGIGDDCAVMEYGNKQTLVTTDMLMEGIHFDLTYISMRQLGYKSAMVNISDVFAMNGTPRQMLVSLALSKRFTVEDVEQFYAGLKEACAKWNVDIVGGDTTSSMTGMAISITCMGEAAKDDVVRRSGARETDLICVSGNLGAAYMGLQILEREKSVYYQQLREVQTKLDNAIKQGDKGQEAAARRQLDGMSDYQPDFAGKEYLLDRQLMPEARGDIIEKLKQAGIRPTSMMDISDGLSSELLHICKQFNMNLTTAAMNGGEDYELLFTVPIGDHAKIEALDDVRMIGHITREELGCRLISRDGNEFDILAQGWNPLK